MSLSVPADPMCKKLVSSLKRDELCYNLVTDLLFPRFDQLQFPCAKEPKQRPLLDNLAGSVTFDLLKMFY